ncbi:MAG: carboxypeptidase-like regulatory domain-containing protein, partial [Armatimonadia bacterium]
MTRQVLVFLPIMLLSIVDGADHITLTGAVVGPDGQPVSNATVIVVQTPTRSGESATNQTATDDAGAFTIQVDGDARTR